MTSGVYLITNKESGKRYIGSSCEIETRWGRHIRLLRRRLHANIHLQRAWDRSSESSFEFTIISECSQDSLIETEQYYIDSMSPEYNISPTAGRAAGVIRSEEYRAKQSQSQTGKVLSSETRRKISDGMKGKQNSLGAHRNVSEETKEKIRNTLLGHTVSDDTKQKIGAKNLGYRHTEEAKEKIRAAGIGRKISQETIEKRKATRARNRVAVDVQES